MLKNGKMKQIKQAIILTSGGLDSYVTSFYVKKSKKYGKIKILFFNYGQKCLRQEEFCVKKLAREIKAELKIIDLKWLGKISTSLINKNKKTGKEEIIKWYVPCRNTIFLISALAYAESDFLKSKEKIKSDIFLGIKHEGEISFNDTKPIFLQKVNELIKVCVQRGKYKIIAPFINKDKENIIDLVSKLNLKLKKTYSCYIGAGFKKRKGEIIPVHCGKCAGCKARKKGFKFSNVRDPSFYRV